MATDAFAAFSKGLDAPATKAFDITPSDTADLAEIPRYVYVGSAGDLKVDMMDGGTVTFTAVPAGTLLPIRVTRVYLTGTTATGIVGLV